MKKNSIAAPFQILKFLLHHMKSQFWVVLSAHHFLRDGSKFFILTIWLVFFAIHNQFCLCRLPGFWPSYTSRRLLYSDYHRHVAVLFTAARPVVFTTLYISIYCMYTYSRCIHMYLFIYGSMYLRIYDWSWTEPARIWVKFLSQAKPRKACGQCMRLQQRRCPMVGDNIVYGTGYSKYYILVAHIVLTATSLEYWLVTGLVPIYPNYSG